MPSFGVEPGENIDRGARRQRHDQRDLTRGKLFGRLPRNGQEREQRSGNQAAKLHRLRAFS